LKAVARVSIKDQTLEQLKHYIMSGQVGRGERLPSERVLAEALGVGRNTVREALKVLEAVGILETRIGDGTYISARSGAGIGQILGLSLAVWGGMILEILDARRIIEVEAARAAAERHNDEDLQRLQAELAAMDAAGSDFRAYLQADMNFHRQIGAACHNAIVADIINNLIDLLETVLDEADSTQLPTGAEGDGTHQAIFDAIVRGDGAGAGKIMREHVHFTAELWRAVIALTADTVDSDDE
jgi:GntR family transcriptional repressor for pyruvate dehydrogenase complex